MSNGRPDEILDPDTGHPAAAARPAAVDERGPQPEAAASPSAVIEVSPAAVPGPAPGTPTGSAHAAQPPVTEPAQQMAAELTQTPVTGAPRLPGPRAGPPADARPGPARPATAPTQRGPEPTASAGGPRELLIPGRTVRSSLMTGSGEVGTRPDPSGRTRRVSRGQSGGPRRRSGDEPTGTTGRESAITDSSGDHGTPDPGSTVRWVPPRQLGASARKHEGRAVIPGGPDAPLRVWRPTGAGHQDDTVSAGQAGAPPPRQPAHDAGTRSRVEQSSDASPAAASAPQLIVMLPPRAPRRPRPSGSGGAWAACGRGLCDERFDSHRHGQHLAAQPAGRRDEAEPHR